MAVLVLNKKPLSSRPYDRWLAGLTDEVILLAERNAESEAVAAAGSTAYSGVELFDDWKRSGRIDARAAELCVTRPVTSIVALSECDVLRAARLRDRFKLAGPGVNMVLPFRDKWVMRERVRDAGLLGPEYRLVDEPLSAVELLRELKRPIVIKPRTGAGSLGVRLVTCEEDVWSWADSQGHVDEPLDALAEEFVEGALWSVDGVLGQDGLVASWVSAYNTPCLSSLATGTAITLLTLDDDDARAHVLRSAAAATLSSTGSRFDGPTAFHAEFFLTEAGPVLCEAHCRSGGGAIRKVGIRLCGMDLEQVTACGQAGAELPVPQAPESGRVGFTQWLTRQGTLTAAPAQCPLQAVDEYDLKCPVGSSSRAARKVSETVAVAVYSAASYESLRTVADDVDTWFHSSVRWTTRVSSAVKATALSSGSSGVA